MKDKIADNLKHNLARVESLVTTYESHPDAQGQGRKPAEVLDILRAAVVLLHATLEDVLRNVAYWKLPTADKAVLDEIAVSGAGLNSKKVLLGDLAAHRGKTVDELIEASIDSYLEHSNYNNSAEIAAILQKVNIDVAKVNSTFGTLQDLMARRHLIVHRADRQDQVAGSGDHEIRAINKQTVREWAHAVEDFGAAILGELGP